MERAYLAMKNSGAGSIAIGIILIVVGVTAGVLSIVIGADLLKHKREITFLRQRMSVSLLRGQITVRSGPCQLISGKTDRKEKSVRRASFAQT